MRLVLRVGALISLAFLLVGCGGGGDDEAGGGGAEVAAEFLEANDLL